MWLHKWTLHIYAFLLIFNSTQISLNFVLQPAVFELWAILRQMHRMIPKWPWTLKGQRYIIQMLQLPVSPTLRLTAFELLAILSKCTEWSKNNLEHQKVKGIPYTCYNYPWVTNVTLRLTISKILASFPFPIDTMINFNLFSNNLNLKFQNPNR